MEKIKDKTIFKQLLKICKLYKNISIKEKIKELNIVFFDCDKSTSKKDVLLALDAIREHLSNHTDKSTLEKIHRINNEQKPTQQKKTPCQQGHQENI